MQRELLLDEGQRVLGRGRRVVDGEQLGLHGLRRHESGAALLRFGREGPQDITRCRAVSLGAGLVGADLGQRFLHQLFHLLGTHLLGIHLAHLPAARFFTLQHIHGTCPIRDLRPPIRDFLLSLGITPGGPSLFHTSSVGTGPDPWPRETGLRSAPGPAARLIGGGPMCGATTPGGRTSWMRTDGGDRTRP